MKFKAEDGRWTIAAWLVVVLPVMAAEWTGFKICYPYADYFIDSYSYIQAAAQHDIISYRPIGYSLFLRAVHVVSVADTFLVTLQYAIVQGASLGLVLSLRRWCGLRGRTTAVLMAFVLLNPLIPYVCNYVSSDALFIGLSLVWLTVLMGLLRQSPTGRDLRPAGCVRPAGWVRSAGWGRWWRLGLQVLLLFVIFNLRYVALFYPAVAALTVLLTKKGTGFKMAGVAMSIGVVVAGTFFIKQVTLRETGADLFSAFSGWQIANNALNLYPHIPVDTAGLPSAECRELAGYVQHYFQDKKSEDVQPATTTYMWLRSSPLHRYMQVYQRRNKLGYFDAWNRVGVVFTQYGYSIAGKHPLAFARYYGWPSTKSFFLAGLDVFAVYNEGNTEVDPVAKEWFRYPTLRPRVYSATIQASLLAPMPWVSLLLNLGFVVTALLFLPFRPLRERNPVFTGSFRLAAAFLLANACFCIFASPSVLRYQVLPMILLFVFTVSGMALVVGVRREPR